MGKNRNEIHIENNKSNSQTCALQSVKSNGCHYQHNSASKTQVSNETKRHENNCYKYPQPHTSSRGPLRRVELDRDLAKTATSPGGRGHNAVHGQIDVTVDPTRGRVSLPIQGEQLVGVDVEELRAVVGCGQLVSHVERDGVGAGAGGHEVVLAVKQAVGSAGGVVAAVEEDFVVEGVDLGVVFLGVAVSTCVVRMREG